MSLTIAEALSLVPIDARPVARPMPEGPGWFGSSRDLHAGLEVREAWHGDPGLIARIENWLQLSGGAGLSLSAT